MRSRFFNEFLYQVFALIIAVIVVHAVYVTEIRPRATEILNEQTLRIEQDVGYTPERSVFVLRQFNQLSIRETAEVLERAEGTVKNLLYRALRKLQKELAVYRPAEEAT